LMHTLLLHISNKNCFLRCVLIAKICKNAHSAAQPSCILEDEKKGEGKGKGREREGERGAKGGKRGGGGGIGVTWEVASWRC